MHTTTLTYLFDPLCGWCYGAAPVIHQLARTDAVTLEMAPTGLFSGGGRTMDAAFAAYAWSNDVRIAKLTGQRFTEDYQKNVLGQHGSRFDSGTTSLALTAVALNAPERELDALSVLQEARYVQGLDTASVPVVEGLLRNMELSIAADRLVAGDAELHHAHGARVHKAQSLMQAHGAQGVPALVVSDARGSRLLRGNALYGSVHDVLASIAAH